MGDAKVMEASGILRQLGLPRAQQNRISSLSLLALAGIGPEDAWVDATRESLTISKGIMAFMRTAYGVDYAENTRETVRRRVMHQFVQARVADHNPDNPSLPTNSSLNHYAISSAALEVVRAYGSSLWEQKLEAFLKQRGTLLDAYLAERDLLKVPVVLPDGSRTALSPGVHNVLQKAVLEEFAPRFVPGGRLLYIGDTAAKTVWLDVESLTRLCIPMSEHDKLPDIILLDVLKNRVVLVEVVTSHGPMTNTRVLHLRDLLSACELPALYVSAFPDLREWKAHMDEIAWETDVWLAEAPDHLVHYNGDKFLG